MRRVIAFNSEARFYAQRKHDRGNYMHDNYISFVCKNHNAKSFSRNNNKIVYQPIYMSFIYKTRTVFTCMVVTMSRMSVRTQRAVLREKSD